MKESGGSKYGACLAGCWTTGVVLLASAAVLVALLGCVLADAARVVADPIDRTSCKLECWQGGMVMHEYGYETDRCECEDEVGNVVLLYETLAPLMEGEE